MSYATYEYYTTNFLGDSIPEKEFPKYSKQASAAVDNATFGRTAIMGEANVPDAVRDATCAAAEKLYAQQKSKGSSLVSENNDGYSVTYRDTGSEADRQREVKAAIRLYLAPTDLMYRGILPEYDLRRP